MPDYSYLLQPPAAPQLTPSEATAQALRPETSPGDYSALLTPPPQEQMSPSGRSQEPMPGWQQGYLALSDSMARVGASMNKVGGGLMLAAGGDLEEAIADVETMQLQEAQQHREDFINTHAYWNLWRVRDLPLQDKDDERVFNLADIPSLIIEGVAAPTAPIIAGGATGSMVGATFGPVGVPIGGLVGAALTGGTMLFGNYVYDAMQRGVPRDHAIVGGIVSGAIGGVATTIGLHKLGQALPSAAEIVFNNGGVRAGVAELATMLAKAVGIDTAGGFVQSSVDAGLKYVQTNITAKASQPMSLSEMLTEIASGTAQNLFSAPIVGAVTTAGGIAAGKRALKVQSDYHAAFAQFNERMEQLRVRAEMLEAEETAKRDAETAQSAKEQQIKAKRSLSGFVQVDVPLSVEEAQTKVETAQAAHEAANSGESKAALKQAKAELLHAKYSAQLNAVEAALTDPNLSASLAAKRGELEGKIDVLKEARAAAQLPSEKAVFGKSITEHQDALRFVKDLEALGALEQVRAYVEEQKTKLQGNVEQAELQVAKAALETRMASRQKAIEHLRAGIREHKAAAKETDIPAATAHKRERLEQLREQQELDTLLLGMLAAGELGVGDIRDLTPSAPTARLRGLAELAKRKLTEAAKLSGKVEAKQVKAAKKLLDGIINMSQLPAAGKAKLKNKYASADLNTLQEIMPKLEGEVNELFDKRRLEAARKDLKAQLESIMVDPRIASIYPEAEEQLLALREFANNPDAIDQFAEVIDNKENLTELDQAKLELTDLFPVPVEEMNAVQIEKIIDAVVELREKGRTEALRRLNERRDRQAAKKARMTEAMAASAQGAELLANKPRKKGVARTLDRLLNDIIPSEIKTWRGLMVMVTQFGDASEMTDILDIKSALSDMHKTRIYWESRWQKMLEDKGMSKQRQVKFSIDAEKEVDAQLKYRTVRTIEHEDGTTEQIEVTRTLEQPDGSPHTFWELIQIRNYLLDTDPDAISRLKHGNEYSYPMQVAPAYSTLEVIERHLDAKLSDWRTVGDTMREFYAKDEFGAVVNETVQRRFGRTMPDNATYGGELIGSSADGSGRFRETYRRMSTRPGSSRARQGVTAPVEIRSAMDNLKNHIAQYSREHAFWQIEADAQALFNDREIRTSIERNIGKNTMKVIDTYIADIILGQQRNYNAADRFFVWLRRNVYSRFLGARPEQFAKQMTGTIHALQFVGPRAMIDAYAYMLSSPKEAIALMNESGLFQNRKLGFDPDFTPSIAGDINRLNNFLSGSIAVGDEYATYGAAFPVLLHELRKTGDKNHALKKFETAFDTTQSSSNVDELPSILRGNPMLRLATIMSQEPTRQTEALHTKYLQWRAGKAKKRDVARVFAVAWTGALLYNLVGYICAYPFLNDDEREQKLSYLLKIAPLGPLSGIAVMGQAFAGASVGFFNFVLNEDTQAFEPELIATDPFTDAYRFTSRVMSIARDGGDTEDWWDAMILGANVLGDVSGLPTTNVLRKVEPFIGIKE